MRNDNDIPIHPHGTSGHSEDAFVPVYLAVGREKHAIVYVFVLGEFSKRSVEHYSVPALVYHGVGSDTLSYMINNRRMERLTQPYCHVYPMGKVEIIAIDRLFEQSVRTDVDDYGFFVLAWKEYCLVRYAALRIVHRYQHGCYSGQKFRSSQAPCLSI